MEKLFFARTDMSPEISFSHEDSAFSIRGNSRPEDVRDIYYPVIEWLNEYKQFLTNSPELYYTLENPMILEFDFGYFNSSSAKFLYDIMHALKEFINSGIPVSVVWHYEDEDIDMKEAGEDLASMAEIDLIYIKKTV